MGRLPGFRISTSSWKELETVLENNFGHDLDLASIRLSPEESGDLLPLDLRAMESLTLNQMFNQNNHSVSCSS